MTDLEKAEKLREKANVSFSEAKEALDKTSGDILDALIYLENQGKVTVPAGGGYYSGSGLADSHVKAAAAGGFAGSAAGSSGGSGETFSDLLKRLGKFCLKLINKGSTNFLEASKGDELLFSCPVIVLVILLIFFFWITLPVLVISMFCGFRYRFSGAELGKDAINEIMDGANNVVDDVKKSFAESADKSSKNKTDDNNEE